MLEDLIGIECNQREDTNFSLNPITDRIRKDILGTKWNKKMKKITLICMTFAIFSSALSAQQGVSINENGDSSNPGAMLDTQDLEKGILHPREAKERVNPVNPLIEEPRLNEEAIELRKTIVESRKPNSGQGSKYENTVSSSAEEVSGAVSVPVFQSEALIFLIGLLTLVGARRLRR